MDTEPHLQPPDIVKQMGTGQGESLAAYVSVLLGKNSTNNTNCGSNECMSCPALGNAVMKLYAISHHISKIQTQ